MSYLYWLGIISILVALCEWIWPSRAQKTFRQWLWSDAIYLIFNGHFLGAYLYGISHHHLLPFVDHTLKSWGLDQFLYLGVVQSWKLWAQILIAIVVIDLAHWCIHRLLHRVPWLWSIHQVHHSVADGEMDWIVAFRFSWLEVVIYKSLTYIPLMWFGFVEEAIFVHAVFGTLIGHLNHANINWDYGPLRYILNSPRMHLHHHALEGPRHGHNFGIIFSCWDWMFKTAYLPTYPPSKIGFVGMEQMPKDFVGQLTWPLPKVLPRRHRWLAYVAGALIIGTLNVLGRT